MKIKFIEEEHKYIGEDDSEYLSVSALIHNLELKKDWDKIRKNYAKRMAVLHKSGKINGKQKLRNLLKQELSCTKQRKMLY